jgi:hypothetical protein
MTTEQNSSFYARVTLSTNRREPDRFRLIAGPPSGLLIWESPRPSCLHASLSFLAPYDGRVRPFANGDEQQKPFAQVATVLYCVFIYHRCLGPKLSATLDADHRLLSGRITAI